MNEEMLTWIADSRLLHSALVLLDGIIYVLNNNGLFRDEKGDSE